VQRKCMVCLTRRWNRDILQIVDQVSSNFRRTSIVILITLLEGSSEDELSNHAISLSPLVPLANYNFDCILLADRMLLALVQVSTACFANLWHTFSCLISKRVDKPAGWLGC